MKLQKSELSLSKYPSFIIFCVTVILTLFMVDIEKNITPLLLLAFVLTLLIFILKYKNTTETKWVVVIFVLGYLLRLAYVLYTEYYVRQHDVGFFGDVSGHAAYIEYYYNNFISLPDFDVRTIWQFYHPPLHHIVSAAFMHILNFLGVSYQNSQESLQMLTLFYSAITMLVSYKLFKEIGFKGKGLIIAFALVAFHPTFIVLSGSINNDPLSILFMLGALYYTVRWYSKSTYSNIIKIALCVGLGMFTKLSVWMVAPAIAFIFLYALIKNKNQLGFKKYIMQFSTFGVVCVPIGMFWSVRNYLLFKVPFSYVPLLSPDNYQYIGYHSASKRLFDFSLSQFKSVYDMWGTPYYEYNPTVGLLKTSMFGEWINNADFPQITVVGVLLFWLGVAIAVLSVIGLVFAIIKRKDKSPVFWFLILTGVVIFVMYYWFCLQYPFTCTQNIRYAAPLIPLSAMSIGYLYNKCKNKYIKVTTIITIISFTIISVATYFLIGFNF